LHFILIGKKNENESEINEKLLNSPEAPGLISRKAIKYEIGNFLIFIYPYDHIDHEVSGYSYSCDSDELLLINGLVNVNHDLRDPDIQKFFQQLDDSSQLMGDYQVIKLDKNGNGFIKTPSISIRQLFFYEDENYTVLSTDIKLIVDGISKFKLKPFVDHFDIDFIEDSVFREWATRNYPESTIFKEIKRVFPHDIKYFKEGKIVIERKDSIEIPQWFRDKYRDDKSKLYDDYYEFLLNFTEINLLNLRENYKKVILGLTGGIDSRLNFAILHKVCKKHEIPFVCFVTGNDTHPDVVLAKKLTETIGVEFQINSPEKKVRPNTTSFCDYAQTFFMSWGDFNSKNFDPGYNRQINGLDVLVLLGFDAYKRADIPKIRAGNRWSARRALYSKNFFFPLLFTNYDLWFGLLFGEQKQKDAYKELAYEILKRSEPKLLDIPLAGDSLPQVDVEPYLTTADSKHHAKEPFLWDYNLVKKNLKPLLSKNDLGTKGKLLLSLLRISELDYFLNKKLEEKIDLYREKKIPALKCIKELWKIKKSINYPKTKTRVTMTKELMKDPYIPKLQILMDFAIVADKRSFEEVEKFYKKN
jgi:hypothetical protein